MKEKKVVEIQIMQQFEKLAPLFEYDFLYENIYEECIGQIILRGHEGDILATVLSFKLELNKDLNSGVFIFYHSQGEFKRMKFDFSDIQSYLDVIIFVQNRLNQKNQ